MEETYTRFFKKKDCSFRVLIMCPMNGTRDLMAGGSSSCTGCSYERATKKSKTTTVKTAMADLDSSQSKTPANAMTARCC